jgi:hypothetical protein
MSLKERIKRLEGIALRRLSNEDLERLVNGEDFVVVFTEAAKRAAEAPERGSK